MNKQYNKKISYFSLGLFILSDEEKNKNPSRKGLTINGCTRGITGYNRHSKVLGLSNKQEEVPQMALRPHQVVVLQDSSVIASS